MNKIIQEIFENYKVNFKKLENYGFVLKNDIYTFSQFIANDAMQLTINIDLKGSIETIVCDIESNEIYTLFLAEGATGVFVGEVKSDYEKVLIDIRDNCFDRSIFKSEYALLLRDYIYTKYGDKLEFLWDKTPNNAVFRRMDNKKWYCLYMKVKAKSIGIDKENLIEIIDFIVPKLDTNIIDKINYFPAYHMNKKNWITIKLNDCTIPIEKIFEYVDSSYDIAGKK